MLCWNRCHVSSVGCHNCLRFSTLPWYLIFSWIASRLSGFLQKRNLNIALHTHTHTIVIHFLTVFPRKYYFLYCKIDIFLMKLFCYMMIIIIMMHVSNCHSQTKIYRNEKSPNPSMSFTLFCVLFFSNR